MDALSNLHSIRADVIEVWDPVALQYKTIQETIVGLPPATLNNLELIAGAIGNDPGYFTTVAEGLESKADLAFTTSELQGKATTEDVDILGAEIDRLDADIATKASTTELAAELESRDTAIALKSNSTYVDSELESRDTAIALKSSLAYVDSELDDIDTAIALKASTTDLAAELAERDTAIALKSSLAYVDSELDDIDTAIGLKASTTELAAELAERDTAIAAKASTTELTAQLATRDTAIAAKASTTELTAQLATRDTAIAAKASTVELESELATRDTAIAAKASTTELTAQLATRDTAIAAKASTSVLTAELATRDTAIATKASTTQLTTQLATRDTAIGLKSDLSYVDAELDDLDIAVAGKASSSSVAAIDTRLEQIERVVVQDAGESYHYIEAGEDSLVIRGPNETAVNILGSNAGAQEGKVLFYKDVLIEGALSMGALSGGISTPSLTVDGSNLTGLLANKENAFTAVLPLQKGFNLSSGDAELKVDYVDTTLEVNWIRPRSEAGIAVDGDLFVDGHLHYTSITSPYWVAGRINGITPEILSSKGRHEFTFTRINAGFYKITWTTVHPDGANFIVFCQGEGTGSGWNILIDGNSSEDLANSETSVTFIVRDQNFALTDGIISFALLA